MSSWEDLVTVALLGTERRPADLAGLPGLVGELADDNGADANGQAGQLLDAAAMMVAYRRAGRRAQPPVALPEPSPPETSPLVPQAAARRLDAILSGRHPETLAEWLATARARGFVAPPEFLPTLLDTAVRQPALAPDVTAVVGVRGGWLAAFRSDWSKVTTRETTAAPAFDADVWRDGEPATRRSTWLALRGTEPAQAVALLTESWSGEAGEDREHFLDLLGQHLGPTDEALLESALDDRRKGVRDRAATLLSRLPTSAFASRMTARLQSLARVERRLLRSRLVVTPPEECDAAMVRDGIVAKPPQGTGERAWWLQQIVAAAPLEAWNALTGADAAGVLALATDDIWRGTLLQSWISAAVRQGDPAWAEALIPYASAMVVPQLLQVIPEPRRAASVTTALKDTALSANLHLLVQLAGPWPPAVTNLLLDWMRKPDVPPPDPRSRTLLSLAGERLDPATAPAITAIAAKHGPELPWQRMLDDVAELLTFRRQMLEELR